MGKLDKLGSGQENPYLTSTYPNQVSLDILLCGEIIM